MSDSPNTSPAGGTGAERFTTEHRVEIGDARRMAVLGDRSVDLILTSPPYPMVEMWDGAFGEMSAAAKEALAAKDGARAFEAMHRELDRVWEECFRVLKPGGILTINVGDAVRTIGGQFRFYPNHARILSGLMALSFVTLPDILWRKVSNAPTKFMGSGMLPAGAYATYEHEYILIARKGDLRTFATDDEKKARRGSAFFWEERNVWFSDVWNDLTGADQRLGARASRDRSAAFPLELAYRLILMHSLRGEHVLDPFGGTGTTLAAAIAAGRSSTIFEIDAGLMPEIESTIQSAAEWGAHRAKRRIDEHRLFIEERRRLQKEVKHKNGPHGFPVMTAQEGDLTVTLPLGITRRSDGRIAAEHAPFSAELLPQPEALPQAPGSARKRKLRRASSDIDDLSGGLFAPETAEP